METLDEMDGLLVDSPLPICQGEGAGCEPPGDDEHPVVLLHETPHARAARG